MEHMTLIVSTVDRTLLR